LRILKERFGNMLRARREEMGFLSQAEFAEALGVDQSRVSRWESGRFSPDEDHLDLICRTLNVSIEYFAEKPKAEGPDSKSIFEYVKRLENENASLRAETRLSADEQALLQSYRNADKSQRELARIALKPKASRGESKKNSV
jgi:transcriptional regulator with XRE-family HTH domain